MGEPGVVVDADEQVVPARLAFGAERLAGEGVAWSSDPAELFDVDVDELAWPLPLVPDDRFGLTLIEPGAAVAGEDRVHGRCGQPKLPAERMRTGSLLAAGGQHCLLDRRRRPSG